MTIKALLEWGAKQLLESDSPRLDAELLLGHVLKADRVYLLAHDDQELRFWEEARYHWLIRKRKRHMPMAYILGRKEFYGLEFEVNRHVLIPRPDTEILVEAVLNYAEPHQMLLDVGTGSGCIPISILKNKPGLIAVATDISRKALKLARKNAQQHQVEDRIQFFQSNLLKDVPKKALWGKEWIVTANLPYVPREYQVNEEAKHEPGLALYAQNNGLELYQALLDQLQPLAPKAIFLECYEFQRALLTEHFQETYELKSVKTLLGDARMLMLERIHV